MLKTIKESLQEVVAKAKGIFNEVTGVSIEEFNFKFEYKEFEEGEERVLSRKEGKLITINIAELPPQDVEKEIENTVFGWGIRTKFFLLGEINEEVFGREIHKSYEKGETLGQKDFERIVKEIELKEKYYEVLFSVVDKKILEEGELRINGIVCSEFLYTDQHEVYVVSEWDRGINAISLNSRGLQMQQIGRKVIFDGKTDYKFFDSKKVKGEIPSEEKVIFTVDLEEYMEKLSTK